MKESLFKPNSEPASHRSEQKPSSAEKTQHSTQSRSKKDANSSTGATTLNSAQQSAKQRQLSNTIENSALVRSQESAVQKITASQTQSTRSDSTNFVQLKNKAKVHDDPSLETVADILGATALPRSNAHAEVQRKGKDLSRHSQPLTAESQTAQMEPSGFHRSKNDKGVDGAKRDGIAYEEGKKLANEDFLKYQSPFDHPGFALFKGRLSKLFADLDPDSSGKAEAQAEIVWREVFEKQISQQNNDTVPMTDRDAGWINMEKLREDHVSQTGNDVLSSFSVVEASVQKALNTQFMTANSFAFWSGPVAKDIVLNHEGAADVGLETSALGGLFDGININGKWDGALWAGLSHMYANAVVKMGKGKKVCVFCSPGASMSNIYTAVEFPVLKKAFETGDIHILNYPCAPQVQWNAKLQKAETISKPDPAIAEGGITGTYKPWPGGIPARIIAIKTADIKHQERKDQADPNRFP
jgi:hypothetical protein